MQSRKRNTSHIFRALYKNKHRNVFIYRQTKRVDMLVKRKRDLKKIKQMILMQSDDENDI
jgi:hypothetical protein